MDEDDDSGSAFGDRWRRAGGRRGEQALPLDVLLQQMHAAYPDFAPGEDDHARPEPRTADFDALAAKMRGLTCDLARAADGDGVATAWSIANVRLPLPPLDTRREQQHQTMTACDDEALRAKAVACFVGARGSLAARAVWMLRAQTAWGARFVAFDELDDAEEGRVDGRAVSAITLVASLLHDEHADRGRLANATIEQLYECAPPAGELCVVYTLIEVPRPSPPRVYRLASVTFY